MWSAEPGIELEGWQATLIRAATESILITDKFGLSAAYPGFKAALTSQARNIISPPGTDDDDETREMRYALVDPIVGTFRYHIVATVDDGKQLSGYVCAQQSGTADTGSDGKYVRHLLKPGGGLPVPLQRLSETPLAPSLTLEADATGNPRGLSDTSEWSAPTEDVFTGWQVQFETSFNDPFEENLDELYGKCAAWENAVYPGIPSTISERIIEDSPPETLPSYPGW
ncbi:hypothetical protein HLB23_23895 [Nocardia uniformis]|uniref:Uncharacterized protein n=1 Tax=Nocardia uniformis TaxID=53432 RepID=A0A849C298_9NOCA|nr:hypothetical protein [Nocardia uniformis]NNH72863.1 hypothetical protein [Nocardia uniformis]